jgi:AcrR family transcriptional regulator
MRNKLISKVLIIKAAEDIIKAEDVKALSVRKLAVSLNVCVGTIYNYFPSLDVILEEVFISSWNNTQKNLLNILGENINTKEKYKKIVYKLDEDISNRKGIGEYLFNSIFKGRLSVHKNRIIDDFISIFKKLLLEFNSEYETNQLNLDAEMIFFDYFIAKNRNHLMDLYIETIITKFFSH